jgi:hypothetical protein
MRGSVQVEEYERLKTRVWGSEVSRGRQQERIVSRPAS